MPKYILEIKTTYDENGVKGHKVFEFERKDDKAAWRTANLYLVTQADRDRGKLLRCNGPHDSKLRIFEDEL